MASDSLGDRMKDQYENRARAMLPRRTHTIVRVDGKAFHTFTRGFDKPNDTRITNAMSAAALALCAAMQGASLAYVQSDEISVLLTDYRTITTEAWFDGNLQKVVSVAASIATAAFNAALGSTSALFDARAFTIPDAVEVENYFIWRQQDATRNSIQGLAQAHFSHAQLQGVSNEQVQEMLFIEKGINWNDQRTEDKRGRCVVQNGEGWQIDYEVPIFTACREYIRARITTRQD